MDILSRMDELRKAKGWSKSEFLRRLGLQNNAFAEWKSGKHKSYEKHIAEIAEVLDTSIAYLVGETDDPRRAASFEPLPGYTQQPIISAADDPMVAEMMEAARKLSPEQLALVAGLIDSMAKQNEKRGNDE